MPRTPTTPAQIDGHRFLMRRIEHALVRADAKMLHDPLRTRNRAAFVGMVLVLVMAGGVAILGLVRPHHSTAIRSDIVTVADTGSMYVQLNGQLHPVANLASARLIVGSPEAPQRVAAKALQEAELGYPLGIVGAPAVVDTQQVGAVTAGVCDRTQTDLHQATVVAETVARLASADGGAGAGGLAGADGGAGSRGSDVRSGKPVSLIGHFEGEYWLIHDGERARVNLADPVVTRALGISETTARPVSESFLRAVPEVAPVTVPEVPGRGEETGFNAPFDHVGAVVEVGARSVLVMREGAAELSPVLADMLRAVGPQFSATEHQLGEIPVTNSPHVPALPRDVPQWTREDSWLCVDTDGTRTQVTGFTRASGGHPDAGDSSSNGGDSSPDTGDSSSSGGDSGSDGGGSSPEAGLFAGAFPGGHVISYPHADGAGPLVDGFVNKIPHPAIAVLVDGTPHLISAVGLRHRVADRRALAALGFASEEELPTLPWRVLVALREGSELTQRAALHPVDAASGVKAEHPDSTTASR